MYLFLLFAVFLLVLFCRPKMHWNLMADGTYMSHERTNMINGLFAVLVFIRHCSGYKGAGMLLWEDLIINNVFPGQLIVTTFFFYSGYGLMCSLQKKGTPYANGIITTRFPKLLLRFMLAVLLFWAVDVFVLGIHPSYTKVILALLTWVSVGNSTWFITMTLLAYLIIGLSFGSCLYRSTRLSFIYTTCLMLVLLVGINEVKRGFYVDTLLCIPAGMLFCLFRTRVEATLRSVHLSALLFGMAAMGVGILCYCHIHYPPLRNVGSIFYAVGVTLAVGCFSLRRCHPALVWLGGAALFPFYIFQRLPMLVLNKWGLTEVNREVYILTAFIAACILAAAANPLYKRIDALLFSPKK